MIVETNRLVGTSHRELIDVSQETKATHDAYGTERLGEAGSFGRNCLLARRLVERGVRYVSLFHRRWDHHSKLTSRLEQNCQTVDQPIGALLGDLKLRGLLDSTASGIDFNYHHDLFDIKAEWLDSDIDLGFAEDGDALGSQQVESWYIQPSLRLSLIPAYFFNKVEFVTRYATMDFGEAVQDQTSIGFNYYFNGSTIFRIAWERLEETGIASSDSLNMMLAIGF